MNEDLFLRNKPQLLKEVLMYLSLPCNCLKTTVYNKQTELIMGLSKIKRNKNFIIGITVKEQTNDSLHLVQYMVKCNSECHCELEKNLADKVEK